MKLLPAAACACALALGSAAWRWARAPRTRPAGEVPVAFWAWRAETPSQGEVDRAARETGARALFVRAGQFESAGGRVRRIRAVAGPFPRRVQLHLVYNSTRSLLSDFERTDEGELAAAVASTFAEDRERAARDGADVAGLQLDIDTPTRLLPRYARVLRLVRGRITPEASLSVTGLPTWMSSAELKNVLAAVDFWAPQFYGSVIPDALDASVPISSPRDVARDVARARELGKPFYAGLAAYGHALLYSTGGRLIELRGDVDPASVARDPTFELVERRPFDLKAARELLGRYLERTAVGREGAYTEIDARQSRRNSAHDQLDALLALDEGAGGESVRAYLGARSAYDAGAGAEELEPLLESASRERRLADNADYLRAALLHKSESWAESARAFGAIVTRHPRSEKREAALFMSSVAAMKTSANFTGTSGDEAHLHAAFGRWDSATGQYVKPEPHPAEPPDDAWHKARAGFERVLGEYPRGRYAADARGWLAHLRLRADDRAGALVEYYRLLGDERDENARVEAAFSLSLVRHHAEDAEMRRVESELEDEPAAALAYAYHNVYNYAVGPGCQFERYEEGEEERRREAGRAERERIVAFATRMLERHGRAGAGGGFSLRVAEANSELGRDREAKSQAERALRLGVRGDERLRALWVRGVSEQRTNDPAAARKTFAALIAEDGGKRFAEGARRLLATAAEDAGDLEAALEHYIALDYALDVAYFVDVLMTTEQLEAFVARHPDSPLRDELIYSVGLRHLRAGRYREARAAYARVRTNARDLTSDDLYPGDDYKGCDGWRMCSPKNPYFGGAGEEGVRPRWVLHDLRVAADLERLELAFENAKGREARAEALYQLAAYVYESSTLRFYNPAVWRGARYRNLSELQASNSFRAPGEAQKLFEHMQEHDTLARSLAIFLRVADEYPETRAARDALYTAAVCHDILSNFNPYWRGVYEMGLHAGGRRVTYDDVRRAYPGYRFPRGTNGWQPASRTVNGGPAWAEAPKPAPPTRTQKARASVRRGEMLMLKGWRIFGEVAGGRLRRWSLAALVSLCILLVFRLTRRSRALLFELLARHAHARAESSQEIFRKPTSSYGGHDSFTAHARMRAASRGLASQLWQVLLDERGRAAVVLNFVTHAVLTLLIYALSWTLRAG